MYVVADKEGRGKHGRCGRSKISLENLSLSRSDGLFRLRPADIMALAAALDFPPTIRAPNRTQWGREEGLWIPLRRLVYPNRLSDDTDDVGRGEAEISIIVNSTADFLWARWHHLFSQIDHGLPMIALKATAMLYLIFLSLSTTFGALLMVRSSLCSNLSLDSAYFTTVVRGSTLSNLKLYHPQME